MGKRTCRSGEIGRHARFRGVCLYGHASSSLAFGTFQTPVTQLVTGVWTGAEDRAIHFAKTNDGEGANTALPIFALYMKSVYADKTLQYSKGDFEVPKGGVNVTLDCGAYTKQQSGITEVDEKLGF